MVRTALTVLIVPVSDLTVPGDDTLAGLDAEPVLSAALTDVDLSSWLTLLENAAPLRADDVIPFTLLPVASRLDPALGLSSTMTDP